MRTDRDTYLMDLARRAAGQTTCIRRGVGCVLADGRGRVLAIAYNGVAAGQPHCNEHLTADRHCERRDMGIKEGLDQLRAEFDGYGWNTQDMGILAIDPRAQRVKFSALPHACAGYKLPPGQDSCEAVHAEQNALVQCARPDEIHTAYVTLAPCPNCTKLLLNTGCRRILVAENHQGRTGLDLWQKAGREWLRPMAPAG